MNRSHLAYGLLLSTLLVAGCKPSGSGGQVSDEGLVNGDDSGPVAVVLTSQALRVELQGDDAQLQWLATAGVSSYELEIEGENGYQNYLVFDASETRHLEPMLAPNVLYHYQVTAYDAGGNAMARYAASARINHYAKLNSDETNP